MVSEESGVGGSAGSTVADILNQQGTVVCPAAASMGFVPGLLISSGRTAAAVVDEEGSLVGAVTENDLLNAFVEGWHWDYPVDAWLRTGKARLPSSLVQMLTVHPSTSLFEAAVRMRAQAMGDFASRHLLVRDEDGSLLGILSSLDLARAVCSLGPTRDGLVQAIRGQKVGEVMKTRAILPTLPGSATLEEAFGTLMSSKQNCLLLASDKAEGPGVVDVITPRDVLRAIVERIPMSAVARSWLHGAQRSLWPRMVQADTSLVDAAATMAANSIHHLVVVSPISSEVVIGVLSSSDLAHTLGSMGPLEDFARY
ncbi:unnamed protein product [Polarella glacialis]|uniref:CBS domain-containing protein n=1 Tax=Polarella glacialis TaxID=89957 RepID=A0A813KGR4_POLGL|nr:unnamed protein product [Polarella glacialis]CAE8700206.1 unnamed protein product [Polarella glacialis]